jgi:Mg2+/Co2+ transporter CorB
MSTTAIALLALAAAMAAVVAPLVALWVRRRIAHLDRDAALLQAIEERRAPEGDDEDDREIRVENAMLRAVLDLAEVTVGQVMTPRRDIVAVEADLPAARLVDEILSSTYTRVPLWRNSPDEIVGVLHAKALLRAVRAAGGMAAGLDVDRIAARPWFVPETRTLADQLQAFRRRREHFALVVDEYGTLRGIVTLEDILEEIVGDIVDEHDQEIGGLKRQGDGSVIVDGKIAVRDLNRELDWELPTEDWATVAGLVLHEARMLPEVGQTFVFFGYRFEVLKKHRHRIAELRVTPPVDGAANPA